MLAALLVSGSVAHAQVEQGTITGTIFDQAKAVVPGARVVATDVGTNVSRETVSTGGGNYTLPYLKAGTYSVRAELAGFSPARVDNVQLRVGLTVTVDVTLKPRGQVEEITVTAARADIEVQTAALGNVISQRQLVELPIVGRNPYNLVPQSPGVSNRGNAGTGPVISGARSNSTEVLLDGAETRNATTNDLSYGPPLESVEEFKVITNGLAAEFGRTGAGVITVATRSGTNAFHGSAYGYIRRDKYNANSWSNNRNGIARGYQHNNDYGFSLGGPVQKDKTFFFMNVERNGSQTPRSFAVTMPTLLERAGDFSKSGKTIYDPLTTRLGPDGKTYVRDPFPGNVIPANRIDPISKKILEYYPLPTNDKLTQNFTWQATRTSKATPLVGRVDHLMGKQRLFAAFRMTNTPSEQPSFNVAWPDPGTNHDNTNVTNKKMSAVLSDTVIFRANL
ncbi:MAG: carboxypeptidase regulatory-like domain-containing protein, partial [Vicinamibacteria bacterium]|nr:carboxypeptidase regulatory-like domain-containing protein [Vicinamibacteria bacterium]